VEIPEFMSDFLFQNFPAIVVVDALFFSEFFLVVGMLLDRLLPICDQSCQKIDLNEKTSMILIFE
jgi:hypothetical protein